MTTPTTSDDAELWDAVKEHASLGVHPRTGVLMARIVWDGHPLTAVGATSNQALRGLLPQIRALGTPFLPTVPNGESYVRCSATPPDVAQDKADEALAWHAATGE